MINPLPAKKRPLTEVKSDMPPMLKAKTMKQMNGSNCKINACRAERVTSGANWVKAAMINTNNGKPTGIKITLK